MFSHINARAPFWSRISLATLLLAAGGCALQPTPGSNQSSGRAAVDLDNWRLSGRLSMSNGRDGGSGQLEWAQQGERMELRFHGAFGRHGWRLVSTPGESVLTLASGERYVAPTVEGLVRERVGWEVPVNALTYWVRGVVSPQGRARTRRDSQGRLALIQQHQWQVEYGGYVDVDGLSLPRKITVTRDRNRVRLLIKRWGIDRPS